MDTFVQDHEAIIRLGSFVGIFLVMAAWEVLAPKRTRTLSRLVRWTNNLGLVALNTVVVRLIFPAAAVGMAAYASARDWGLLNHYDVPYWLAVVVAVVVLRSEEHTSEFQSRENLVCR